MRLLSVLAYLVAIAPLIATPGTSLALLTHRVSTDGSRAAAPVILGTVTGLYIHATLAGLGLSTLVMRSSEAFTAIRLTGALYLLGLGIWTWRSAGTSRRPRPTADTTRAARTARTDRSTYRQALLGNVLNPKAASIFLTLTPQFLTPGHPVLPQILLLATAQALLVTTWLLLWTPFLTRTTPTLRPFLTRLTAATLIATALHTATP
ncbi:LysE family translocator [Streptomyces sp. NRRL WC-3742]|uniref:LysE family translocator n=1 Tax=Streptomyces sp. NRRL WC-3742 TaxID=1463934 RepID=UPI0004C8F917|nr:LysE family translocator [Streptomyces sp. NRRL WC-3742]